MDTLPSGLSALLWFAAVVAAIPLVLWLVRRTPIGAAATAPGAMRTVAALALGPGQRVVTVEIGHGAERRWLVLGVTAQQITTLHEMAPAATAHPAAGEAAAPLRQLLGDLGVRASGAKRDA
ncbi:FliO/MopB family protein [Azohydromonas sediminis]|uniref:FliO/MopB family protein n=1 Tax=Azohydromonas sediminis TaxID=2259674 RepID=UPI000E64E6BD|nr:flagellar biosynthetic protein FliO [Azohydromonas sediminis]